MLSRQAEVVGEAPVTVLKFCRQRGFSVTECHGNGEFGPLRAVLANAHAHLNVTAEDEHVPEVEQGAHPMRVQHCAFPEDARDDDRGARPQEQFLVECVSS
jgi:hypothetical protein